MGLFLLKTFTILLSVLLLELPVVLGAPPPPCREKATSPEFPKIELSMVTGGLKEPLGLVHAGDATGRIFVLEQEGTIRVMRDGALEKTSFLDIRGRVNSGGEKGLLGLAFHPNFSENGRFFVNYTAGSPRLRTVISEFKVSDHPNRADPETERVLLSIPQPYSNHNGGNLAFGPDGMLYIGMGDGGSGDDPHGNGQNLNTLLGKMLRIDVDPTDPEKSYGIPPDNPFVGRKNALPEIWAYGLRNPWRFSFDTATGRLYAGDVGQRAREEIDMIEKGKNYGWNIMEGSICTPGVNPKCSREELQLPILDYPRSEGTAVIGGYVYRGHDIPALCGAYVYADYGNGRIFAFRYDGRSATDSKRLFDTRRSITSLGEDEQRELYVVDGAGDILKIISAPLP